MSPRHKPATAWPWVSVRNRDGKTAEILGASGLVVGTVHAGDAPYIVHAVNGYAGAVATLRAIRYRTDIGGVGMQELAHAALARLGELDGGQS